MKDFEYKTSFSAVIKPLVSEEKDKYLAMASLLDIGEFLPEVDAEKNVDLLPVAFNAFVANRVNKNGDVIDTPVSLDIYKSFINKPINIEHDRHKVVGTILTANFSEFATDRPIEEDKVKDMKGPFNITLGGVIWRVVNNSLSELIESSSDPTSQNYMKVSASWELGFSDYELILMTEGDKNIENALETIEDKEQIEELKANLKSLGGTGKLEDGRYVYRKVTENVVPLGIGLTETPAADVRGVATPKKENKKIAAKEEKKISQSQNNNVKSITEPIIAIMKITKIEDITNEVLQQVDASQISEFIQEELKKASEDFHIETHKVENDLKDAQEKYKALSKEGEEMKTKLEEVSQTLEKLEAEKATREAEELFNTRMASLDEAYELDDEDRKVISADIKEMADENFSAYEKKMKVLMRHKNKATLQKEQEESSAKTEEAKDQTEASSSEEEKIVEEVMEQAEAQEEEVPASTDASDPSVYDRYRGAFSFEEFNFNK